jgi:hypothetical protein
MGFGASGIIQARIFKGSVCRLGVESAHTGQRETFSMIWVPAKIFLRFIFVASAF